MEEVGFDLGDTGDLFAYVRPETSHGVSVPQSDMVWVVDPTHDCLAVGYDISLITYGQFVAGKHNRHMLRGHGRLGKAYRERVLKCSKHRLQLNCSTAGHRQDPNVGEETRPVRVDGLPRVPPKSGRAFSHPPDRANGFVKRSAGDRWGLPGYGFQDFGTG